MGCSCETPSAPAPIVVNPAQTATGQAEFNLDTAKQQRALNMIDQYTPQGSVKYESTGKSVDGVPTYKVTQSYSPEQQKLYDTSSAISQQYGDIAQSQLGQVEGTLSNPFTMDQFGTAPQFNESYRQQQYDNMLTRMQPQLDADRAALETQLANQGFQVGTSAYDTAMDQYNRQLNDARLAADMQSLGMASQYYGLETNTRDRAINEALMERTQPLSEMSALISGSQPTSGAFLPTPQGTIAPVDYGGMAYGSANMQNAYNQNAYNQQMGMNSANLQGLYGLGGAGIMAASGYDWG